MMQVPGPHAAGARVDIGDGNGHDLYVCIYIYIYRYLALTQPGREQMLETVMDMMPHAVCCSVCVALYCRVFQSGVVCCSV